MTDPVAPAGPARDLGLRCAACGRVLDPTDKFCRDCGLPTLRRAEAQRQATVQPPPDVAELRQAFDTEPRPQAEASTAPAPPPEPPDPTTGSVVKVTSPTFAAGLASSTALMVVFIILLAGAGLLMFVLAVRP